MKMKKLLILSAATGLLAGNAFGQDKPLPSKGDPGCTTFPDGRIECVRIRGRAPGDSLMTRYFFRQDSAMMRRAALGVELRPTGTRRDTLGVFIAAVTPRGPAETAGIIEGDRIAAINGVDVRSAAADVEDPYTNGIASHRLTREVQKLTPGARVTLRVYSAGRFRDVVVTAGRASEVLRHAGRFNLRAPGPAMMEFRRQDGPLMSPGRMRMVRPNIMSAPQDLIRDIDRDFLELEIEPMETEVIRELVTQTVRDATEALRKLAAMGIA
jgi:hypothetical protein